MGGFREDSGKRTERDGAGTTFWKIFRKESVNIVNLIVCIMLNHEISSNSWPGFGLDRLVSSGLHQSGLGYTSQTWV